MIGLDAANWNLLMPWIREGYLPNLKKILDNGCHGNLKVTIPAETVSVWTSFTTGKNPGKHGVFSYLINPKNPEEGIVTSACIKEPNIWEIIEKENKKSCVINVPLSYPVKKMNGFMVSGFLGPNKGKKIVWPREYLKELNSMGYLPNFEIPMTKKTEKENEELLRKLSYTTRKRFELAKKVSKNRLFDLYMVIIKETDIIQHLLYNKKDSLLSFFKMVDKEIGDIISFLVEKDPDIVVFLVSDHSFGASPDTIFNIYPWLIKKKFAERKESNIKDSFVNMMKKLNRFTILHGIDLKRMMPFSRKIYGNLTKASGENRVLLYPAGISISDKLSKKDKDALTNKLILGLKNLKDEKGRKVFVIVEKREKLCQGRYTSRMPEIVLVLNEGFTIDISPTLRRIFEKYSYIFPGEDKFDYGIFCAEGKGIKKGKIIKNVSIMDIAPTALFILDSQVPKDMDGKILKEIFEKKSDYSRKKAIYSNKEEKHEDELKRVIKNIDFGLCF